MTGSKEYLSRQTLSETELLFDISKSAPFEPLRLVCKLLGRVLTSRSPSTGGASTLYI